MVEDITKEEFEEILNQDYELYIKRSNLFLSKVDNIGLMNTYIFFGLIVLMFLFIFTSNEKLAPITGLILFIYSIVMTMIMRMAENDLNLRNYSLIIYDNNIYYLFKNNYYKINFNDFNKMYLNKIKNVIKNDDYDYNYNYIVRFYKNDEKIFTMYFLNYIDYMILYYFLNKIPTIDIEFGFIEEYLDKSDYKLNETLLKEFKKIIMENINKKKSKYFKNNKWIIE